jgi:hypothetical protein
VSTTDGGPLAVLSRIRQGDPRTRPGERCELCAEMLAERHGHLVDLDSRSLLCACRPCTLLFTREGAAGGRYRAVPERYLAVTDFSLGPSEWAALQIPVGVAFFLTNARLDRTTAFYPSPAGATECELELDTWAEVLDANPVLKTMEPDVEAALVRTGAATSECFVVPIDACYELVGTLRKLWRGFDGGAEARAELEAYFDRVRRRAQPTRREPDHG